MQTKKRQIRTGKEAKMVGDHVGKEKLSVAIPPYVASARDTT